MWISPAAGLRHADCHVAAHGSWPPQFLAHGEMSPQTPAAGPELCTHTAYQDLLGSSDRQAPMVLLLGRDTHRRGSLIEPRPYSLVSSCLGPH